MPALTVLFDGRCALCRASVARAQRFDSRRRIEFLDLHDPSTSRRFPSVRPEEAMQASVAVDGAGRIYRGSDAWARIGRELPGWKAVAWILLLPGVRWIAGRVYAAIASNRYRWNKDACADGSCATHLGKPRG